MCGHKLQTRQGFSDCVIYSLINLQLGTYKIIQDEIRELKHELAKNIFKMTYREYHKKHGYGTPEFFIPAFLLSRKVGFKKMNSPCKDFHGILLTRDYRNEKHAVACNDNLVYDSHYEKPVPIKKYHKNMIGSYFVDPEFCRDTVSSINLERRGILNKRLGVMEFI